MLNFSATQQFDYHWQPLSQARMDIIPNNLKFWLRESGSLTALLKSAGALSIEVINDGWGQSTQRERKVLSLRAREATRVREVVLNVDGTPMIYARSIIPASALIGHWRHLNKLNDQSLGGFLFKDKRLVRSPIEVVSLPSTLFHEVNEPVWARRSIFKQYNRGVLVSEAFLPAITTLPITQLIL